MTKYFFWGILAAAGALILEFLLDIIIRNSAAGRVLQYELPLIYLIPAISEEILKLLFIKKTYAENMAGKKNYFTAVSLIGLGFYSAEFVLTVFNASQWDLIPDYILGGFFIHMTTVLLMAAILAKTSRAKWLSTLLAVIPAIALHMAYNLLIVHFF